MMRTSRWVLWIMPLWMLGLLGSAGARADWKGEISITSTDKTELPMTGEVYSKGDQLLFNMMMHGTLGSILMDMSRDHAVFLFHALHATMVMIPSEARARTHFQCPVSKLDECLSRLGFKKTGTAKLDGHPCAIYEGDEMYAKNRAGHQKFWRPLDMKDVLLLKSETRLDTGQIVTARVTGIQRKRLDKALFEVPSGYAPFSESMLPPGSKMPSGMH